MPSATEKLQSKLSDHQENAKKRDNFFIEISDPLITCAAIGVTYSSLQSDAVNTAAWGAVILALFALHIGLAAWKARNG